VLIAQRAAGHSFDRKHPLIAGVWRGIANTKAKSEVERQATPILAEDLRAMLATLRPQIAAEARDAAILALGWSAALRRSELVGLDWQKLGRGRLSPSRRAGHRHHARQVEIRSVGSCDHRGARHRHAGRMRSRR
jgi:integrase